MKSEDRLPPRTFDFLQMLDEMTPRPRTPETPREWASLADPATLVKLAGEVAQRQMVDRLLALLEEDADGSDAPEDADGVDGDGDGVPGGLLGRVLEPHRRVREIMLDVGGMGASSAGSGDDR